MQKTVSTVIEGVPVTLEFISIGPASPDALNAFEKAISPAEGEKALKEGQIKLVTIGTIESPATPEQINQVQNAISTGKVDLQDLVNKINEIEQAIQGSTQEKPWWTSKIIISNLIYIGVTAAAVFGFNVEISEETIALVGSLMGILNIFLRKGSNKAISAKMIPDKK